MTTLTADQKARVNVAQNRVTAAADKFAALTQVANAKGAEAQACQAARDAKSTGIAKNRACPIDTLSALMNAWDIANQNRDSAQAEFEDAKRNLNSVLETIAKENLLAADALKNDPAFNLQTQANMIKAEELSNQAKRDRNKKIVLIVAIVALVGVIVFSVWYILKKKKANG